MLRKSTPSELGILGIAIAFCGAVAFMNHALLFLLACLIIGTLIFAKMAQREEEEE